MEAEFTGQDYILFLEKDKELIKVREDKLEATLTEPFRGKKLDKLVTLSFGENNGPDGINLKYIPKNPDSWDAIKEIRVTINERAYNHIRNQKSFGTRYNGSDKIEIHNGNPRYEF